MGVGEAVAVAMAAGAEREGVAVVVATVAGVTAATEDEAAEVKPEAEVAARGALAAKVVRG